MSHKNETQVNVSLSMSVCFMINESMPVIVCYGPVSVDFKAVTVVYWFHF